MCRVFMGNKQALDFLDDATLENWLLNLEYSFGGHGNGVAVLTSKGTIVIAKGVNQDVHEAVQIIRSLDTEWFCWHTRLASAGAIMDSTCHPFRYGNLTLIHNGHNSNWAEAGKKYGYSDTQALSIAAGYENDLQLVREASGVFMGFKDNKPFVLKRDSYSDLVRIYDESTGMIIFASEPCEEVMDMSENVLTANWTSGNIEDMLTDMTFCPFIRPRWVTGTSKEGKPTTWKVDDNKSVKRDYEWDTYEYGSWERWNRETRVDVGGKLIPSETSVFRPAKATQKLNETMIYEEALAAEAGYMGEEYLGDEMESSDFYTRMGGTVAVGTGDYEISDCEVSFEGEDMTPAETRRQRRKREKRERNNQRIGKILKLVTEHKPTAESCTTPAPDTTVNRPSLDTIQLPAGYGEWTPEQRTNWWLTRANIVRAAKTLM
jgi:hypothetical protein